MLVKCISKRLNHTHFVLGKDGSRKPMKIEVGDVFEVKGIPASWHGLVEPAEPAEKVAITNPAQPDELADLKAEYKAKTGNNAHHTWDAEKIRAKLEELNNA